MTSGKIMEAPYSIAALPKPLDSAHGSMQAAPVYSIRESRKRKRHEVAVGIDGEGVNIYNVQSQRLVASYALSPQSYLCLPPCSVYLRGSAAQPAQRRTYVIVKNGPNDRKRQLVCFKEEVRTRKTSGHDMSQPEKDECRLQDGDVASLDVVPSASGDSFSLIVTYASGDIVSAAGDLSKSEDIDRPISEDAKDYVVEFSTVFDSEIARKRLLKNREDVLAQIDQQGAGSLLLCRIIRTNVLRRFQLFRLRGLNQDSIQTLSSRTTLLIEYPLEPPRKKIKSTRYELHPATGTLYQLAGTELSIHDLSGTFAKFVTRIGGRSAPVSSFTPVSANAFVLVSGETATLYETKYGSIPGIGNLASAAPNTRTKKRKREGQEEQPLSFDLVSCFTDVGLVVGISNNELVALQIDGPFSLKKDAQAPGVLFASVMESGSIKDTHASKEDQDRIKKWQEWTADVDNLVEADNMEGLEKFVANDRSLGLQRSDERGDDGLEDFDELDKVAYEELWPLPEAFDAQHINGQKVLYILGKIFTYADSGDDIRLRLAMPSEKLIEWLALAGFLTVGYVQKALSQAQVAPSHGVQEFLAQPGDIMAAIRRIDEDFQLIRHLLSLPVPWEVEEVIQALRILVQSFDQVSEQEPQLALPAPPQTNGDAEMTNGDVADPQLELESAEHELDYAINALDTGLEVRSETLQAIFVRLHEFSHALVTATMRNMMSHRELVFFIHILRMELADAGWTSRYVDVPEFQSGEESMGMVNTIGGLEEKGPNNQAIQAIADLLNCVVDAIGISGWLVGLGSAGQGVQELLSSLRAEVGAGLEGCFEANTLQTYLQDIERYVSSSEQTQLEAGKFSAGDSGVVGTGEALLPVGGRAAPPVVGGRKGHGAKKSKIARAQEKSRSVGKYSFERIRI